MLEKVRSFRRTSSSQLILAVFTIAVLASPLAILPLPAQAEPEAGSWMYQVYSTGSASSIVADGTGEDDDGQQEQQASQTEETANGEDGAEETQADSESSNDQDTQEEIEDDGNQQQEEQAEQTNQSQGQPANEAEDGSQSETNTDESSNNDDNDSSSQGSNEQEEQQNADDTQSSQSSQTQSTGDESQQQSTPESDGEQNSQSGSQSKSEDGEEEQEASVADQVKETDGTDQGAGEDSEANSDLQEDTGNQPEENTEENQASTEEQNDDHDVEVVEEDEGEQEPTADSDSEETEEEVPVTTTSAQEQDSDEQADTNGQDAQTSESTGDATNSEEETDSDDEEKGDDAQELQEEGEDVTNGEEQSDTEQENTTEDNVDDVAEQGVAAEDEEAAEEEEEERGEEAESDSESGDEGQNNADDGRQDDTEMGAEEEQSADAESEQEEDDASEQEQETDANGREITSSEEDDGAGDDASDEQNQQEEVGGEGGDETDDQNESDENPTDDSSQDGEETIENDTQEETQGDETATENDEANQQEDGQDVENTDDGDTDDQQPVGEDEDATDTEEEDEDAAKPIPEIKLWSSFVRAGSKVLVSGSNFDGDVSFAIDSEPLQIIRIGKNNDGSFKAELGIPQDLSIGVYMLTVTDDNGNEAMEEFTVISPTLTLMSMKGDKTKWMMFEGFDFAPMACLLVFFDDKRLNGYAMSDHEGRFTIMIDIRIDIHKPKNDLHTVKVFDDFGNEAMVDFTTGSTKLLEEIDTEHELAEESEDLPKITLDPKSGVVGDETTILGDGFVEDGDITVMFDDTLVDFNAEIMTEGTIVLRFNVPDADSGLHEVKVSDSTGSTATAEFNLLESDIDEFGNPSDHIIHVSIDKSTYVIGETAVLSGEVYPIFPKEQVVIQIFNPNDARYRIAQIPIDEDDGSFSYEVPIDGRLAVHGAYHVLVTYIGIPEDLMFTVTPTDLIDASTERATISAILLLDQAGDVTTTAEIGNQVTIEPEITNEQSIAQSFTAIMQIKDSSDLTVKIAWISGELEPNQSMKVGLSWVPDSAGEFTIEVFVWESIDKPVPLSLPETTNLTVQ